MQALSTRIRKARLLAGLSQAGLAQRVGVRRSAATQWEHPNGTVPSMHHLLRIAAETGACAEWLATGRGPMRPESAPADPATAAQAARDAGEDALLALFRRLSPAKRRIAMRMLEVLGGRSV